MAPFRVLSLVAVVGLAGCAGPSDPSMPATATPAPAPTSHLIDPNWTGDAAVLSATGSGGCGWGRAPGTTSTGVLWHVAINGPALDMYEDVSNYPTDGVGYTTTLNGTQFAATYSQPPDGVCQFAGGTLVGSFSPDFQSFDADETLTWGSGAGATRVLRGWHATKK